MEILEKNEIEKLLGLGCSPIFDCTQQLKCVTLIQCLPLDPCLELHHCLSLNCRQLFDPPCRKLFHPCSSIYYCGITLYKKLTEDLKACGEGFYRKCPGFDKIGEICGGFDPAIDFNRWKDGMNQKRIEDLEAKVKELELKKKG